MTVGGIVTGTGNLTKTGAGTVELAAASTYNGSTTISAGTLRLNANGTIPNSSNLTINGSGSLNVRNTAGWIYNGTITGDGTGASTLNTSTNATLAGNISGVTNDNGQHYRNRHHHQRQHQRCRHCHHCRWRHSDPLRRQLRHEWWRRLLVRRNRHTQLNIGKRHRPRHRHPHVRWRQPDKIDNTSGADLTLSTNNAQAWNNDFNFLGTDNLNLGTVR